MPSDPVGFCIYCGATDKKLTDEHIVPFSLDANEILPQSSCLDCNKITSYLEGYCARHIFLNFRTVHKLQTRRPKDRPKKLPLVITYRNATRTELVDPENHPGHFIMTAFRPPGFLRGGAVGDPFGPISIYIYGRDLQTTGVNSFINERGGTGLEIEWKFSAPTFARFLAKVAHAAAIAKFGLESFLAFLPAFILRAEYSGIHFFVGGQLDAPRRSHLLNLRHHVQFQRYTLDEQQFIVAHIRLFANEGTGDAGTPIYTAVVGELTRLGIEKIAKMKQMGDHPA